MTCDCCLMPTRRPELGLRAYHQLAFICLDCVDLIADTGLPPATIADFVQLCWSFDARVA